MDLSTIWRKRLEILAQIDMNRAKVIALSAEAYSLQAQAGTLHAEAVTFLERIDTIWAWAGTAEADALWSQLKDTANTLHSHAAALKGRADTLLAWTTTTKAHVDTLWCRAVLKVHGDIPMEWTYRDGALDCRLETGEVFRGGK